jgi:hypothetical protein
MNSVVKSGTLAYLTIGTLNSKSSSGGGARFVSLSSTISSERSPKFAEVIIGDKEELIVPVIIRALSLYDRRSPLKYGTPLSESTYMRIESTQSPPNQGKPLTLLVGTGGDSGIAQDMHDHGFPVPAMATSAGLCGGAPSQTPLFCADEMRPELSSFLIMGGIKGELRFGDPFHLLSSYGFLGQESQFPTRLSLLREPDMDQYWRLLPYSTVFSQFPPDGCLAHLPSPTSLLGLTCTRRNICSVSGHPVYLSREECERDVTSNKDP